MDDGRLRHHSSGNAQSQPENARYSALAEYVCKREAVLFETGKWFRIKAAESGIRFLLLAGKPLREPIAWGGPIVMNSMEELELAFTELDNNTFIK